MRDFEPCAGGDLDRIREFIQNRSRRRGAVSNVEHEAVSLRAYGS